MKEAHIFECFSFVHLKTPSPHLFSPFCFWYNFSYLQLISYLPTDEEKSSGGQSTCHLSFFFLTLLCSQHVIMPELQWWPNSIQRGQHSDSVEDSDILEQVIGRGLCLGRAECIVGELQLLLSIMLFWPTSQIGYCIVTVVFLFFFLNALWLGMPPQPPTSRFGRVNLLLLKLLVTCYKR